LRCNTIFLHYNLVRSCSPEIRKKKKRKREESFAGNKNALIDEGVLDRPGGEREKKRGKNKTKATPIAGVSSSPSPITF